MSFSKLRNAPLGTVLNQNQINFYFYRTFHTNQCNTMCFTHSEAVHVCEGWSRFCRIEVFLHSLSEELKNLFIKHFSLYFMKPPLILSGLNTADLSLWARRCSSCPVSERGEAGGGVMVGCWIFPPETELVFIFWTRVERNWILVILTLVPFFPFLPPLLV